jgi:hypothetical protein
VAPPAPAETLPLPRSFRIARGVLAFFLLLTLIPLAFDVEGFLSRDIGYQRMSLFFLNGPLAFAVFFACSSLVSAASRATPEARSAARGWQSDA